ncbi:4002_t:CDS:2, partial [Funneliformis caledonium]
AFQRKKAHNLSNTTPNSSASNISIPNSSTSNTSIPNTSVSNSFSNSSISNSKKVSQNYLNTNDHDLKSDELTNEFVVIESETEQIILFNLIVKPSDYLVTFKPEKVTRSGVQLVNMQDYKKFLLDYKKLSNGKKNMTIMTSLKKKEKRKNKKKSTVKLDDFSEILQQEGHVIHELRKQYKCSSLVSKQPISLPSLDEFFTKLDELSGGIEEFARFKNIFENERITVDQIYDLTNVKFDQLGVNKIGWRRATVQRYK